MFNYICLGTNNLARAAQFYDASLGALGIKRCDASEISNWVGWGIYENNGQTELALWLCEPFDGQPASVGNGTMVALQAKSWSDVNAFHAAAIANGGQSEGAPGLRPQYNDDFYAAYVRDPDGNKLAAVCRSSNKSHKKIKSK